MKAISIENVSKKFILSHSRPRNLAEGLRSLIAPSKREEFWALKDVSFDVEQGETLGIIGHNGAGKSTMLKLLTGIMKPTSGRIRTRGRVSALIEVGAGFHPELTGRENIYLNGSILGMTRREIDKKLDSIISFAELEQFIDTPVKRYSSGMYVRLGFSVAAHIEPEVLLVDEVLAVGDVGYQRKCLRRMMDMANSGVTVVLVSHNLAAIEDFCESCILLSHGKLQYFGEKREALRLYLADMERSISSNENIEPGKCEFGFYDVDVVDDSGRHLDAFAPGDNLTIQFKIKTPNTLHKPQLTVGVTDNQVGALFVASNLFDRMAPEKIEDGDTVRCKFLSPPLKPRSYAVWASMRSEDGIIDLLPWQKIGTFKIENDSSAGNGGSVLFERFYAPIDVSYNWDFS